MGDRGEKAFIPLFIYMFDKKDLAHVQNLARLLNKASMTLEGGQEILAAGDVFRWVGMLHQRIQEDLQLQETKAQLSKGEEAIKIAEKPSVMQSLPETSRKKPK